MFEFYEKPMSNNNVVQAKSALSESVKIASLTEEVVRRLKHTSQDLPHSRRMETLENLSQKMVTSGHKVHFMKRILTTGIIKYERKVQASKLDPKEKKFKPLYLPSGRQISRLKTKCMARENWYMGANNKDNPELRTEKGKKRKSSQRDGNTGLKASTVMFLPSSKGGTLLMKMRENEIILALLKVIFY